ISYPVTVVGIKYYYDNYLSPKILFTEEGFETHTAIAFAISSQLSLNFSVNVGGEVKPLTLSNVYPYYSEEKKVSLKKAISKLYPNEETTVTTPGTFTFTRSRADGLGVNQYDAVIPASSADVTNNVPSENVEYDAAYVSTALIKEWMRGAIEETYTQASLIFDSDREAHAAIKVLNKNGYIAVASDAVNENDSFTAVLSAILSVYMGGIWIGLIAFFAFFISLLTNRSMTAFKSDMAIMRSMGITMGDIRFATYVRVLMTVIPAIPMVALVAFLIYTTPFLNQFFTYLYFWQYALIFAGIILMAIFVTRIQLRRLFRKSVKKSIRKGEAA
ncbi:MAG: hypothetical protein J6U25_03065, partial [Clostridia bacterium]|nr:hypothetical protein [Clostridia bacterium]